MPSIRAALFIPLLALSACAGAANVCETAKGVTLQVLGSGGPIADDARASSGYLLWVDGESKILVDAGGGTFLRFGEADAKFGQLDHIAISHYHTDHSADLVALLKSGYFSGRDRDLTISGPDGGGPFPGLDSFLEASVGKRGAYAYLSGYTDGSAGLARLQPLTIDPARRTPVAVFGDDSTAIRIEATGVPHGIVPALAYRVRVRGKTVVFSGDQNGDEEEFIEFARNADALVMHMAVPENISGAGRRLHAPPSRIGQIAKAAEARVLVLSHFMRRSLRNLDSNIEIVRSHYDGRVIVAEDLQCIKIND